MMTSRPTLIQCLKNGLSAPGSIAVDQNNDSNIYNDAKLPYNVRVAPDVAPLAIAFGECFVLAIALKPSTHTTGDQQCDCLCAE